MELKYLNISVLVYIEKRAIKQSYPPDIRVDLINDGLKFKFFEEFFDVFQIFPFFVVVRIVQIL